MRSNSMKSEYLKLMLSSEFGKRLNPYTNRPEFYLGCDYLPQEENWIYAGISGTVTESSNNQEKGGYYIRVQNIINGAVFSAASSCCKRPLARKNEKVKANDVVAIARNNGKSRGKFFYHEIFTFATQSSFVLQLQEAGIEYKIEGPKIYFDPCGFYKYCHENDIDI